MKRNVKQQQKPTRRLLLITGVCSILGITLLWFLFYTFSGNKESLAGKDQNQIDTPYIENENLTEFEVEHARVRPANDPVVTGTARYKEVNATHNE